MRAHYSWIVLKIGSSLTGCDLFWSCSIGLSERLAFSLRIRFENFFLPRKGERNFLPSRIASSEINKLFSQKMMFICRNFRREVLYLAICKSRLILLGLTKENRLILSSEFRVTSPISNEFPNAVAISKFYLPLTIDRRRQIVSARP